MSAATARGRRLLAAVLGGLLAAAATPPALAEALQTRNVILITLDGVRIQEIFAGMDPLIVNGGEKESGIYDLERALNRFWRPTARQRREALMPFFWGELAPRGVVLGNKAAGSHVTSRNPHFFSAPGYAEILTGRFQPEVTSNELRRYPHDTVLDFVQRSLRLGFTEVAMIGSWEGFKYLASSRESAFFTNGGYDDVPAELATPRMRHLSELQHDIMALWEVGRSDAVTFGLALEYLQRHRPRLFYLALGESDDWTHARRYDRYLDYLHVADGYLRRLWTALQSVDPYRDRTTLILTTDHGRGVEPADWIEHEAGVAGAEDIWIAIIGPDTPDRGELAPAPTVHQADVAATLLRFFGLAATDFDPACGPPIAAAFGDESGTTGGGDDR